MSARPCTQANGKPGFELTIGGKKFCVDPSVIGAGVGAVPSAGGKALGDLVGAWGAIVLRIAVGGLALVLIALGLLMIAGEATLNQAASRIGRELRKAVPA